MQKHFQAQIIYYMIVGLLRKWKFGIKGARTKWESFCWEKREKGPDRSEIKPWAKAACGSLRKLSRVEMESILKGDPK